MTLDRNGSLYARLSAVRRSTVQRAKFLDRVHATAYVHRSARVSRDLVADEWVFIGPNVHIDPMVAIGRYSMLAPDVVIAGDDHIFDEPGVPMQFTGRPPQHRTVIGRDVWIGRGAMLKRGVSVGDGAIVAARSVVTKDVAPFEVVAGSPATQKYMRFDEDDQVAHLAMLDGPVVQRRTAPPLPLDKDFR